MITTDKTAGTLEKLATQLETASLIGLKIIDTQNLDLLFKQVTNLIRDYFNYCHVSIFTIDDKSNEILLREVSDPSAEIVKNHEACILINNTDVVRQTAVIGKPVINNCINKKVNYFNHTLLPNNIAELAVPIQIHHRIIGVLDVRCFRSYSFDDSDVKVLQILSNQIASAIESARLFRETNWRLQAMTALHETSLDIVSRLDKKQVLEAILHRAADLLKAPAAAYWIYEPESNLLRGTGTYNHTIKYQGVALPMGEGVVGKVVETGRPLVVNNYLEWDGRSDIFLDSPHHAVAGVPLLWQGNAIGALVVLDRAHERSFTNEDVWLLSSFADLASTAIINAELYGKIAALSSDLQNQVAMRTKELALAKSILAQKAEQLQRLLTNTIHFQEEERARIARDMHDSITQLILGALYAAEAANSKISKNNLSVAEDLGMIQEILQRVEAEIHQTIYDLHPPILEAKGVTAAIKQYVAKYEKMTKLPCTIRITGSQLRLPITAEIAIYRIVQEALQNIFLHAKASRVLLKIHFSSKSIQMSIEDDGIGFDLEEVLVQPNKDNIGLIGMRERAESIAAELRVFSSPGNGSRIVLLIPISF